MLATQPGLGRVTARRLGATANRPLIESDGRSDLIIVGGSDAPDAEAVGAEDLFVLLTEAGSRSTATATAAALFEPSRWQVGLDRARHLGIRIGARTTFRVIVRVRSERGFKRTDLRAALEARVRGWRPRWRVADPAALEFWVLESRPGRFRLAARVSSSVMRQRGGRLVERRGALRPAVAAAMIAAAGPARGTLVDPFCGSGTILSEAIRAGWKAIGSDIDPGAVASAQSNVPAATVTRSDVRELSFADDSVQTIVTNPPFGKQHQPETAGLSERKWWDLVLDQFIRIIVPGAPIVLLHPDEGAYGEAIRRPGLRVERIATVKTLGQQATIWRLREQCHPRRKTIGSTATRHGASDR